MAVVRDRRPSDLSVGQMTLNELKREFARRVDKLRQERSELVERIVQIDRQLADVAVEGGPDVAPLAAGERAPHAPRKRGGRTRASNEHPLWAYLQQVLVDGEVRSAKQLLEAVSELGYSSTAQNPAATITATLTSRDLFERVERGRWTLSEAGKAMPAAASDGHAANGHVDDDDDEADADD
ncbi:MAG: hypothetical protein AB8G96_11580 [Phycisphaerales bacterium]